MEYYIEARDDGGRTSTFPGNIAGFDDVTREYNRTFTVRALPSYSDTDGNQPKILFWNDFGHRGGENEYHFAFAQNGFQEGIGYDTFTTMGPSSLVDDGLGSTGAHGASADQLAGYNTIFYDSGNLGGGLMSDGLDAGQNDKGDDIGVLTTWFNTTAGDRFISQHGDDIAFFLSTGSASQLAYLSTIMGVSVGGADPNDVRGVIGNQTAPKVIPTGAVGAYTNSYVAYGACLGVNDFDYITANLGAVSSHSFTAADGVTPVPGPSAGVVWDRLDGSSNRKVSVTFPFGLVYAYSAQGGYGGQSGASALVGETLALFGGHTAGTVTDNVLAQSFALNSNRPNPFNPKTTLSFTLGRDGVGSIKIYNVRGELVRTLSLNESFAAGANTLEWNGTDNSGASVASGVYVVKYAVDGFNANQKVVMVK
jgi:hypothetical protein